MTTTKDFELGDILSVTTGKLVSTSGKYPIEGVYAILNYMTGESLFTHQLPRVSEEAGPIILRQHPQLAEVDASGVNSENWRAWLDEQIARFGASLPITPMTKDEHEYREPLSEMAETIHPSRIIPIVTG